MVGAFPSNISAVWTVRGTGYKILTYILYKITDIFVDFSNKILFDIIYRAQLAIIYVVISFLSVHIAKDRLREDGFDLLSTGFLIAVGFLTVSHWVAFQAEDVAALFTVFGVGSGISNRRYTNLLSAGLLALTITFKGITGMLAIVGVALVVAYDGDIAPNHAKIVATGVLFGVIIAVCTFLFLPMEVYDLVDATKLMDTNEGSFFRRAVFMTVGGFLISGDFMHLPILLPAAVVGMILISEYIRQNRWRSVLSLALIISLTLSVVTVQAKGHAYHYAVLLPVGIGIIMWFARTSGTWRSKEIAGLVVISVLVLSTLTVTPLSVVSDTARFSPSPAHMSDAVEQNVDRYKTIEENTDISQANTVLYLSGGSAAYYLGIKTELRYFYPIPLQKGDERSFRRTQLFRETYSQALQYEGRYVIYRHDFINMSSLPRLERKIDAEYEPEYAGDDITIYRRVCTEDDCSEDDSFIIDSNVGTNSR
jgi:hypothetical protein